ncbi:hypothetical protein ACIQM0_01155 [Streptomyces sp. NPDC091387]|uniref:hypothetical protein n=1 Tax=Streptomyces sp. NPDC091387 TaxID=3365998 RepID=UPI0037FB024F
MVLACRSEARGKEAEARLKGGIPEVSKAHFVPLDLTARTCVPDFGGLDAAGHSTTVTVHD